MSAARPAKKIRRSGPPVPPQTAPSAARVSLTSLPIEILADILLRTCSPPTVLAVSRTCSFLHRTLAQNPAASFIWRGVRNTCEPFPLPDPGKFSGMSEADYAALVFGGGVCEACRRSTRAMYVSFAVRIRLCHSWHCRCKFLSECLVDVSTMFPRHERHSLWVPFVESKLCFYPFASHPSAWPNLDHILVRKTDLEKFQLDCIVYADAERARSEREDAVGATSPSAEDDMMEYVVARCIAAIQRFPKIMELSTLLSRWKAYYDQEYGNIKKLNRTWTSELAEFEGWAVKDLVASKTYGSLQRRKNSLLEMIESNDVLSLRSAIDSELLEMQARRRRQQSEAAYKERLTEVRKIYERMRCGTVHAGTSDSAEPLVLPLLSVFCTLPSVCVLKGTPSTHVIPPDSISASSDLKSSSLAISLIVSDIHTWLIPIQTHLVRLLGYPNGWQSASTRTLPPLKRVTARFFCRRCGEGEVGGRYQRQRCLDFRGVCSHVCATARRKRAKRGAEGWEVDVFVKDEKAIRLIKTVLELMGLSEEDPGTASKLNTNGDVIRCLTCRGWIVMDFDSAVGHAHRHERMEIELLSTSALSEAHVISASDRVVPSSLFAFGRGTAELLLGRSYRGRNLRKKVNYGCRHCCLVDGKNVVVGKGARAMSFNGLRSHIKEKHGIQNVCDEDLFCVSVQDEVGEHS